MNPVYTFNYMWATIHTDSGEIREKTLSVGEMLDKADSLKARRLRFDNDTASYIKSRGEWFCF